MTQINPAADALVGEWLSLSEVATRLGLPTSRVKQLFRDRKLLAVTRPTGERAVPAAFIDGDQIVKGLSGTLTVLFDCGFGEDEALRWLFTADETLPARRSRRSAPAVAPRSTVALRPSRSKRLALHPGMEIRLPGRFWPARIRPASQIACGPGT